MVGFKRRLRFAALTCVLLLAAAATITAQSGGAMPTPTSKAQPTPNKPRAGVEVTKIQLRAIKRRVGEPCPANVTFRGAITTNGPTTVEYTWLSSDGRSWPTRNLKFAAAGTQSVTESWKLGQPGKTVGVWIQMQVASPNRMFSNKVTENFTCAR
ncbi:MAG TPA: hypothetical protein VIX19_10940 [Terriglobales bacterium]